MRETAWETARRIRAETEKSAPRGRVAPYRRRVDTNARSTEGSPPPPPTPDPAPAPRPAAEAADPAADLRARALALRAQGWGNVRIRAELGISGWRLQQLFHGHIEPVHARLAHRAKPELRARARELREQGWSYTAIARTLRVSKSSLSLWLRDLPRPERHDPAVPPPGWEGSDAEWAEFCTYRMERHRQRKAAERQGELDAGAREVGALTDREVLLIGAVAYWCEGAKSKPWRRQSQLSFINSDPELICFYLRFLEVAGVGRERLRFALQIHERADVDAATEYWERVTGADRDQFRKPVVKRHTPAAARRNTGEHYKGALTVYVRRSSGLYRRVEGIARAVMTGSAEAVARSEGEQK